MMVTRMSRPTLSPKKILHVTSRLKNVLLRITVCKKVHSYINLISNKKIFWKTFFIASKMIYYVTLTVHLYVSPQQLCIGVLWMSKRLKSMRQVMKFAVVVNSLPSSPSYGKPIVISDKHQFVKLYTLLDSWNERFLVVRFRKSLLLMWKSQLFLHTLEGAV